MTDPIALDPRINIGAVSPLTANRATAALSGNAKARATAEDFETTFINTMFETMFNGVGADGPLGNGPGTGIWRSFLTNEYAKTFAKAGGIGIADQVYRALIEQQAAQSK